MLDLKTLPYPQVIENLDYEKILSDIKNVFKEQLNDSEISLLQSDSCSALLETLAYRELILRARINSSVKSMLLPYASGSDLDNVVAIYGIERLKGEKPTTNVKFSLSTALDYDVFVPANTILLSQNRQKATLKEPVIITAGQKQAFGVIVLDEFVLKSSKKCEFIQTPLPFLLKAEQISEFIGGAERESDDRLRQRAVLSLHRFSTAGSIKSYIYQALSANTKVEEVSVLNGGAGVVNVYLKTTDMSEETRASVADHLNGQKVRPLTDSVIVANANIIDTQIRAELELVDMFMQNKIDKAIKTTPNSLKMGEDLNLSYIYSVLHKNGVYRVNLQTPTTDTKVSDDSFARISFNLRYKKAQL
ncbi:baseplate J/gp47 family protein [Campylobacter sp. 9BO]|uniref:baseplate assembly protein n=1 Tax=Campylobacter sp. 9BO TaxID=3424759 RepID=UPI003D3262BB